MRNWGRTRRLRDTAILGLLITASGVLVPIDNQHLFSAVDITRSVAWAAQAQIAQSQQPAATSEVVAIPEVSATDEDYIPAPLPEHSKRSVRKHLRLLATAYSSSPDETSGDPTITATGTKTRWGVVASNYLPLGTQFRIPSLYGYQIFRVEDTHSKRLGPRIDIWYPSKAEALRFGVKRGVEIELLEL